MKAFEESLVPVKEITLALIEPDPDLAARNKKRADEKKEELGKDWIGHKLHAAQRRDHVAGDVRTTILRARAVIEATRQHANNVRSIKREAA